MKIKFDSRIPSHFAIITIMILGFLMAWFTINTGEKLVGEMPQSKIYDSQKTAQKMIDQNLK